MAKIVCVSSFVALCVASGNVYLQDNLNYVAEQIADQNDKINIVVSDGGFLIQKNEEGIHMENFQELYSGFHFPAQSNFPGRIILSEILAMMKVLQPGGHFVCKLYDCFSDFTVSLIYVVAQIFEQAFIVKPVRSRIVNSER